MRDQAKDNRTTVRLPPKLQEKLVQEVVERGIEWEDRGTILVEALSEYFRRRDPEYLGEQIKIALRDDPSLLDESLKRIGLQFFVK